MSQQARFQSLDSLRGIAAYLVALHHFWALTPYTTSAFRTHSYLFVDFFFVLSGFVISWSYSKRILSPSDASRFLLLRLFRLYPLHICMILFMVGVQAVQFFAFPYLVSGKAFADAHSLNALITNLAMLQSFGLHDIPTWNFTSWSISAELWVYVAFACARLLRAEPRHFFGACIAAAFILKLTPEGMHSTYSWGVIRCVYGFSVGVLCCFVYQAPNIRLPAWMEVVSALAVICFIVVADGSAAFWAPPLFGVAIVSFAAERGCLSRLLRLKGFQRAGEWSYSIYLVHLPLIVLFWIATNHLTNRFSLGLWGSLPTTGLQVYGHTVTQGWIFTGVFLVVTTGVSGLTYRYIEKPCRDWGRAIVKTSMRPEEAVVAPATGR